MPTYNVTLYLGDATISMPVQAPNEEQARHEFKDWLEYLGVSLWEDIDAALVYPMEIEEK